MRRFVFAAVVLLLLGFLVLVASGHRGGSSESHPSPSTRAVFPRSPSNDAPPPDRAASVDVRRFLAAFLAFEAGERTPPTRRALRATSRRRLAGLLLTAPQTSAGARGSPAAARLLVLHLHRLPGHRELLLASGTAVRPGGQEPFSFIFARRAGRWLAVAPGE